MIAALGTLPFLATLWLLVVLGARVLEEDGGKILAALKGTPQHLPANDAGIRGRTRARASRLIRESVEWRAAA
jgi:hypothetical protein